MTKDVLLFTEISKEFFNVSKLMGFWLQNKYKEEYSLERDKPLNQIYYENYLICSKILSYLKTDVFKGIFFKILQKKHFNKIYADIQKFEQIRNQIKPEYCRITLDQILAQDTGNYDFVKQQIEKFAGLKNE